ncbi:phage antirepressor KilAC domain-containing protein [Streptacidiphilus sp. PAMC 29251]
MDNTDFNLPASVTPTGSGLFDQIRRQDETGEYWSCREISPLLGYAKWERVPGVIARAAAAAKNSGMNPSDHFRPASQLVPIGSGAARELQDFRLTRYGAYLLAMNGDPRKPEVAEAQTYFAVQTRIAEVLQMPTHAVALRGWAAELEAREAAEARAAELTAENRVLAPKAGKWDQFMDSDGLIGMTELADILKTSVRKMTEWLVTESIFRKQTSAHGGNRNLPRTVHVKGGHFEVKLETKNGFKFPVAYATSEGVDLIVEHWERQAAA